LIEHHISHRLQDRELLVKFLWRHGRGALVRNP